MKVINLYGGPGCGKSTTAAALFVYMKLKGMNVELVTEYAKDLVWDNRLEDMLDQQEYIFAKQNHRLHRLREKVDYAITDSPLLLSTIYPSAVTWPAYYEFCDFVRATDRTYDNINIYLNRLGGDIGREQHQEVGRAHNYDQSLELDTRIYDMLANDIRTPFNAVDVDVNVAMDIMEIVLNTSNEE